MDIMKGNGYFKKGNGYFKKLKKRKLMDIMNALTVHRNLVADGGTQ